ncbi:MAG: hypothetical protein U0V49_14730 [Saprospiraceae bacterium]
MITNTPALLSISLAPVQNIGESYVAVRHIKSKQDQKLIRQLPKRYRSPKTNAGTSHKPKSTGRSLKIYSYSTIYILNQSILLRSHP